MEVEAVEEIAWCRAAFISNPLFFLKKHRELRSLISKDHITFPQPRKTSKSVLDNCGVRFSCPKKHYFFCLLEDCFHNRTIIGFQVSLTDNDTSHLLALHNVIASKTESHQWNIQEVWKHIENSNKHFLWGYSRLILRLDQGFRQLWQVNRVEDSFKSK
jgi:hypothetical protein